MTGGTSSDLARKVVSALDLPTALRGPRTDFDKYRLQSDPSLLRTVVAELSALIPPAVEILGGLEVGGATLAAAMSLADGRPWVLIRRRRGTIDRRAAGASVANRRIVVVKDMTQSGTALLSAAEALRAEGAIVEHAVCAIDWTADAKPLLAAAGVELRSVLTFDSLCESWREKR